MDILCLRQQGWHFRVLHQCRGLHPPAEVSPAAAVAAVAVVVVPAAAAAAAAAAAVVAVVVAPAAAAAVPVAGRRIAGTGGTEAAGPRYLLQT